MCQLNEHSSPSNLIFSSRFLLAFSALRPPSSGRQALLSLPVPFVGNITLHKVACVSASHMVVTGIHI